MNSVPQSVYSSSVREWSPQLLLHANQWDSNFVMRWPIVWRRWRATLWEKWKIAVVWYLTQNHIYRFYEPQTEKHSISITNRTRKLLSPLTEISRWFCDVTYCCGGKRVTQECLTRKWDTGSALTNTKSQSQRSSNRSTTRTLNQLLYSASCLVVASSIKRLL
jgi:hypothetical protein